MRALIFDMDGVIVDSEIHWKTSEGFFLKSLVSQWGPVDQGRITGISIYDTYDLLAREYGLAKSREEFMALYQEMAKDIYLQKASLIEGFRELLILARDKGMRTALASSSRRSWIEMVLGRFDLLPYFDAVVSIEDLPGAKGKPEPDIYLRTAEMLGVQPSECIVIEDSTNGVLSARRAGMFCIGFRNGFNEEQDLSEANVIVEGYRGIQEIADLGLQIAD
jgi:HAD superfamily hydrolase (TIGR01509 family)